MSSPGPKPLNPKPKNPKPKTKGPLADTKISWVQTGPAKKISSGQQEEGHGLVHHEGPNAGLPC